MKDTMIGVDLAKRVFQLHGASMTGHVAFRKKLTRERFRQFMAKQRPCVVVFEACGSASYWAREVESLGHEVRLIAPQYVRPFVKRQKNDAADAEAIVIAAQRPEMRFVAPKSEEQQARAVLFRARERLVHQRTELVNALRGILYEYGHVVPQGIGRLERVEAIVDAEHGDLPALVRDECRDRLAQIKEKTVRIDVWAKTAKEPAAQADTARRLQTMPGVGPLTALAIEAVAPDMASFRSGRDFAAWPEKLCRVGTPPAERNGRGGCQRPANPTFAATRSSVRRLIIGAVSRSGRLGRRTIPEGSWLARLLPRKPRMLVAITSADKRRGRSGRC